MTTASMRLIANKIDAAGLSETIKVVEISVDPARDTPQRLTAYQAVFGAANWTLASGTESNLTKLWDFFGAPPERQDYTADEMAKLPKDWQTGETSTYDVIHPDIIVIIDPQSNWRWLDLGHPSGADLQLPAKIRAYLTDEGIEHLESPDPDGWTVQGVLSALSSLTGSNIKA